MKQKELETYLKMISLENREILLLLEFIRKQIQLGFAAFGSAPVYEKLSGDCLEELQKLSESIVKVRLVRAQHNSGIRAFRQWSEKRKDET